MEKHLTSYFSLTAIFLLLLVASAISALAETHVVEMRNADKGDPNTINVFDPAVLHIDPGDTVRFVVIDKGHNSASKKGMLPEGTDPWNGKIDEEIEVTFERDGTYGYICVPHYEMGMVGLVLVGDYEVNFDEARKAKQRSQAKKAFRALFETIEQTKLNGQLK